MFTINQANQSQRDIPLHEPVISDPSEALAPKNSFMYVQT